MREIGKIGEMESGKSEEMRILIPFSRGVVIVAVTWGVRLMPAAMRGVAGDEGGHRRKNFCVWANRC